MNSELQSIASRLNRIESMLETKLQPEFLTIIEASELLRCSKSKVRDLIRNGELPFCRVGCSVKGTILIRLKDIKRVL